MKCRLLYTHLLGIVFDYADLSKITDFVSRICNIGITLCAGTFFQCITL